jgi:POTRA domain, FtsQ-type
MTEKKKLPQRKVTYNYWAITEQDPSTPGNIGNGDDHRAAERVQQQQQRWHQDGGRRQRESVGTPVSSRRVVTVPPTDPSYAGNTFVERQRKRRERAQLRDDRGGQAQQTQYVARTLAQTGTRASSGRMPVARRPLPRQQSPVPTRSGRQKPPRNRLLRFLSFLTTLAIIIVTVIFAFTSNAFHIAQVTVVGTHNDVLIQRVQKMGMQGKNIFLLDVTGLTTKIEAFPEVDTADLNKQWPNQLVVSIKERVPVLLWQTLKATFSVDSQGMVIAPASNTAGANHLSTVIDTSQQVQQNGHAGTGKSEMVLHPGMWINKGDITFAAALLKQLPTVISEPTDSFKLYYNGTMYSSAIQTSEEGRDSSGSYSIENSIGGWRAYLGNENDPNPLSNRLLELRSILNLAQQQQMNVATIDLRYGLHPVFTLS